MAAPASAPTAEGAPDRSVGWPALLRDVGAALLGGPSLVLVGAAVVLVGGLVVAALAGPGAPTVAARLAGLVVSALAAVAVVVVGRRVLALVDAPAVLPPLPRPAAGWRPRWWPRPVARDDGAPTGAGGRADGATPEPGGDRAPAAGDPSRAAADRRWWPPVIEVVLGAAVVALVLWPVPTAPADQLAGGLDAPYHAWLGWRIAELWRHGDVWTMTVPDAFAPIGFDLRLVDGLLPAWVTAAWSLVTGGSLILAYNLALATGLALDLWAGRALGRVLTARRWLAFAGGVAFATAPALLGASRAHLAFVWAFPLPLLVRRAVLTARGAPVPPVRTGLLVVLAFLCSAYHLIFGVLALVLVLALWPASAGWRRPALVRLAAAAALAAVVLAPFLVARLAYERDERAAGAPGVVRLAESRAFSADVLGALHPTDGRWLGVPLPSPPIGAPLYADLRPAWLGVALLGGLGLVLVARSPARRALVGTAAGLWVLSLGPGLLAGGHAVAGLPNGAAASWLPFRALLAVPALGALRAPTRASFALAAVLAAALVVGVDALLQRRPGPRPTAVVAVALALALGLTVTAPLPTSDLGLTPQARAGLEEIARRGRPGDAVLFVPAGCRPDDPRIIALQSVHRQASIGCNPPPTATRWFSDLEPWVRSRGLAALRCDPGHLDRRAVPYDGTVRLDDAALTGLRADLGARFVVVDRSLLPALGCDSVRAALPLLEQHDVVADDGTWEILDLDRPRAG